MSEFGIRISNIQAASIFECNCGIRDYLDTTHAMLVNSLFKDFLVENGLNLYGKNNDRTRDIICILFDYGSRNFKEEEKHLLKLIDNIDSDIPIERQDEIRTFYQEKLDFARKNKNKYIKKSKQKLREDFYKDGVDITYHTRSKKKPYKIKSSETIHYRMLYRTPGKAKKGTCMFIREELYEKAREFLYMGIKLPEKNAPIVEIGAYSSLITSSIEGKIEIDPKNILVIKDVDSECYARAVCVEVDENGQSYVRKEPCYKFKNTLFDGQALIDSSIFPEWGNGYILLRHHMCKMAAFNSHIQLFISDWCEQKGINYNTLYLEDIWGNKHLAKDIKLITTENAMKWMKFDVSYDYWSKWVNKNGNLFGIVKTAHKSKLGNVQQMSYQMVNSLDMNNMDKVVTTTKNYVEKLKNDDEAFLEYLRNNENFSNDFEVLLRLVEHNPDFIRSYYFKERRRAIIKGYIHNIGFGKLLQEGDNLVIVGSPYAMLLHTVGENVEKDDTFNLEEDAVQCYTKRFKNDEYLAGFRSPFNSRNNINYLHNVYSENMDKYFNFGEQIIAVNLIHTAFQDRNNGSDQDSDSLYVTNQNEIVQHSKYCCKNYPTIKNNIPQDKKHYDLSFENYARIDNELASAQTAIGESSNIAQQCLTYTYNDIKGVPAYIFEDYVCILSVLAQVAIDNAKRKFDIDLPKEISRIKKDLKDRGCKYPKFWIQIKKRNDKRHSNKKDKTGKQWSKFYNNFNTELKCPMNQILDIEIQEKKTTKTIPTENFIIFHELVKTDLIRNRKVENLIQKYSLDLYDYNLSKTIDDDKWLLLNDQFEELIKDLKEITAKSSLPSLMSWLLNRAFSFRGGKHKKLNHLEKNKSLLLKVLYDINEDAFLSCFKGK